MKYFDLTLLVSIQLDRRRLRTTPPNVPDENYLYFLELLHSICKKGQ